MNKNHEWGRIFLTGIVSTLLLVTLFLGFNPVTAGAEDNPVGSGAILRSGFGARALGMGGAYVAIADDYSAAYWNPAGVTRANSVFLGGMRYDKFGLGLNLNYLSGGLSISKKETSKNSFFTISSLPLLKRLSLSGSYTGFSTNVRTLGPGGSEIPITYGERSFLGTTGLTFPLIGSFGLSAKYYNYSAPDAGENGQNASASGIGYDLGYLVSPLNNLSLGLAAFDITGTSIAWNNTPTEPTDIIPARYSVGSAYEINVNHWALPKFIKGKLRFAGQYSFGENVLNKIRGGIEYDLSLFALRAGAIKPESGKAYFSTGAGVKVKFFSADVAWVQNSSLEGENVSDTIVFSSEFQF